VTVGGGEAGLVIGRARDGRLRHDGCSNVKKAAVS
jgi:hypothetical protein